MKLEPFGWYAPRAPKIAAPAAVSAGLEFLVNKADDSSLEPNQETVESYRQGDPVSLEKLFGISAPERRADVPLSYEDMTKAIFGNANPTIMDVRTNQPVVAPKQISASLEKRGKNKNEVFNGSTTEVDSLGKWTYFFFQGQHIRSRLEPGDGSQVLEFDSEGDLSDQVTTKAAADLTKSTREMPQVAEGFENLVKIDD